MTALDAPQQTADSPAARATWVLVDTMGDPRLWGQSVIAEGAHIRHHSRLGRTKLSRSRSTETQIVRAIRRAALTGSRRIVTVALPTGCTNTCIAIPVRGSDGTVLAVEVWAGRPDQKPPARGAVAAMTCNPATGDVRTSAELEQLLRTDRTCGTVRTMPDLSRYLRFLDRPGLMDLFGTATASTCFTAAVATVGSRRLRVVAHRLESGQVGVVLYDVAGQAAVDDDDLSMTRAVLPRLPLAPGCAIGLADIRTGIILEWLVRGPYPLGFWAHQHPQIHPDDIDLAAQACGLLLSGRDTARCRFRVRFTDHWVAIDACWSLLDRYHPTEAVLELRIVPTTETRPIHHMPGKHCAKAAVPLPD
ncbi:MAG: DUF5593 domain-containing protein [Mycobacterium sp.]|nr:DUF5593 domain-containing protein [Mycobacterium sp.]